MQAGRGFAWETSHDALPGCVGSGLQQVPGIQHLPRQGDHRRLQKRRTAACGLKEKAVNAGCFFCVSRSLSQCPPLGNARLPPDRQVLVASVFSPTNRTSVQRTAGSAGCESVLIPLQQCLRITDTTDTPTLPSPSARHGYPAPDGYVAPKLAG